MPKHFTKNNQNSLYHQYWYLAMGICGKDTSGSNINTTGRELESVIEMIILYNLCKAQQYVLGQELCYI